MLQRGRPVYAIQVSQAVVGSIDLLIVGLMSRWADVGLYSAPHRMVTAVLAFGLIFQQVVFPSLARSWRDTPEAGRRTLDMLVRVLVLGFLPVAVGATVLAGPLVAFLFQPGYADARLLLALGVWRAPLLSLAFLYQTTLIALNREAAGVRMLLAAAVLSGPVVAGLRWGFGLPGAAVGVPLVALGLLVAGYRRLASEGRRPAWHHHLGRPLLAALAMVPVCLLLVRVHVLVAVAGGALTYGAALTALGGLRRSDFRTILRGR
jgi:O-antigen/teichoic acid export membrane protein